MFVPHALDIVKTTVRAVVSTLVTVAYEFVIEPAPWSSVVPVKNWQRAPMFWSQRVWHHDFAVKMTVRVVLEIVCDSTTPRPVCPHMAATS